MTTIPHDTAVDVASSLDLSPDPAFLRRAEVLRSDEPPTLRNQLRVGLRLLRAAGRGRPLILFSAWGGCKPDLLVAALLGLRRRRPATVMVGEVWKPTPGWRQRVERWVVRRADRGIDRYLTSGRAEELLLADTWGVAPEKIASCRVPFAPAAYRLTDSRPPRGDHVFAGGDSIRDYPALLQVARQRPDLRFVIATTVLDQAEVPVNVELHPVRIAGYPALMREAGAVVVPIVPGLRRGAGALTFLMAMWLRKPVVVTRSDFTAEYVESGVTGFLVDGSPAQYRAAIERVLDPANAAETGRIGDAAHDFVERCCTFPEFVGRILDTVDRVVADRTGPTVLREL